MSVSVAQPERNTKPAAATRRFSERRAFMPYCERIDIAAITGGPALASKRADIVNLASREVEISFSTCTCWAPGAWSSPRAPRMRSTIAS